MDAQPSTSSPSMAEELPLATVSSFSAAMESLRSADPRPVNPLEAGDLGLRSGTFRQVIQAFDRLGLLNPDRSASIPLHRYLDGDDAPLLDAFTERWGPLVAAVADNDVDSFVALFELLPGKAATRQRFGRLLLAVVQGTDERTAFDEVVSAASGPGHASRTLTRGQAPSTTASDLAAQEHEALISVLTSLAEQGRDFRAVASRLDAVRAQVRTYDGLSSSEPT